ELHSQLGLVDQVGRVRADDVHAENSPGLCVGNDLEQTGGVPHPVCLAQCNMPEPTDLDLSLRLLASLARLLLSQSDAADLWESEDAGWDHVVADLTVVSHNVLDRNLPLRRRDMCQHGLADEVSNSINAGHVGLQSLADEDLTTPAKLHPNLLQPDVFRIESSSDRHQELLGHNRGPVFQDGLDRPVLTFQFLNRGAHVDCDAPLLQLTVHKGRDLFILEGENAGHQFHHGDLCTDAAIEGSELTSLDAGTDNQEASGDLGQVQCLLARDDLTSINWKKWQVGPGRAGRKNDGVRLHTGLGAVSFGHPKRSFIEQLPPSFQMFNPPGLEQRRDAFDQCLNDLVFSGHHP